MAKYTKTSQRPGERYYRMSELVDVAGVSRDMIKYYLRAQLLPKPRKPRPNLSLYSENHLLLIGLILRIQQQTTLSLPEIASVFLAADYDAHTIEIELLSGKYSTGRRDQIIPFAAETKSNVSLTFPQAFLAELEENGLLEKTDPADESQMEIAGLLWAARNAGVPMSFFQAAREQLHQLADLEVKSLIAIQRPQLDFNAVVASVTSTDRVINHWMISEKTRLARRLFQRIMDNSEKALATVHDAIYLPSKVFRKRFRIDEEVTRLASARKIHPQNLQLIYSASRACLLLTDYARAIELADAALILAPEDDLALAIKCLAYGMDNKLEQALPYARHLEASNSQHAIALEARLLTLLMQAAKLGGMSDTSNLLKQAAELFREPHTATPRDGIDRLEACLLQARANTLFQDAINSGPQAIGDLEAMLESLEHEPFDALGLPLDAIRIVYQVYASFYLGQLHEAAGDRAHAKPYFEKVIQLDPSSNFGEMAYLKLG